MQYLAERKRDASCCAYGIAQNPDWLLSSTNTTHKMWERSFAELGGFSYYCQAGITVITLCSRLHCSDYKAEPCWVEIPDRVLMTGQLQLCGTLPCPVNTASHHCTGFGSSQVGFYAECPINVVQTRIEYEPKPPCGELLQSNSLKIHTLVYFMLISPT